jgi:hypothetical protein
MRDALLHDVDDYALGRAMAMIADVAHSVVQGGWGLWEITDETVGAFVRDWRREEADRRAAVERDS